MNLSDEQIHRYSRQIVLKEIGGIGQKKLLNSKITIIGLGALGSIAAYYLTAAGIGSLKLVDFDKVELSNLHRQILHSSNDINKKKSQSAFEKLSVLNPDCKIELIEELVVPRNVKEIIKGSDFVIEGSDNFPTKMLINDACVDLSIPFTVAGVLRFHGQIMSVIPKKKTACYRCLFGDVVDSPLGMSCSQAGVIGLIPGIIGSIEANEAIKYILNIGELLINKILFVDLKTYRFTMIDVYRTEDCLACGVNPKDLVNSYDYGVENACH
jgi:adenylyltransferase/sulfurtransferase